MTPEMIEQIALANGFKLKEQPDGSMALNPYVFEFARALLAAAQTLPAQSNVWKEAVLLQCMAIEGCYIENNPIATMNCLIDWHVRNAQTPPAQQPDPLADLIDKQEPLGSEFEKVLHDNLDALYETDAPAEHKHGSWNHLSTRGTRKELEEDSEKLRKQVKRDDAKLARLKASK